LLDDPRILDAVPEGGRVRFVRATENGNDRAKTNLEDIKAAAVQPQFEDGFMVLLQQKTDEETGKKGTETRKDETARSPTPSLPIPSSPTPQSDEVVVQVRDLVRRFGTFIAVNNTSFDVHRGEIFGLLGPNGAGKTTTFRMLCGLLPATSGTLQVAGVDLRRARASARQRIGYVAQKFSLYGQLSVDENLDFFASAYGLHGGRKSDRIDWALKQFELSPLARLPSGQLPGGYKQRLAMAAALLHQPETLFLDEPTSGVDPLARREFWRRITAIAEQGITVIVTTHFMEEAEYCDRVAIMDAGQVLAQGTPAELRSQVPREAGREPTMEDAFIAIVEKARGSKSNAAKTGSDA
jgi:ABC-2 type transport system ATP-binding protein